MYLIGLVAYFKSMIKRYLYIVAMLMLTAGNAVAKEPPVIVELFTSQGCAACPTASSLISKLASEDENIVPFIWAVDYWDYLGWQDTMAIEASGTRQEAFNTSMNKNGVFTPQVIINGAVQTIGSREGEIRQLIKEQTETHPKMLEVHLAGGLHDAYVKIGNYAEGLENAVVTVIWFKNAETVRIASGDNRGKLFHYTNVVRATHEFGALKNFRIDKQGFASLGIEYDRIGTLDANCLAVMVQESVGGKIIGFAKINFAELAN